MDFQKKDIIDFLNISLQTTPGSVCGKQSVAVNKLPKVYNGLSVKASVGMGVATAIPWISFTGYNQKTSNGIYPVILFYHARKILIVAFGISVTNKPAESWDIPGVKTINQYFVEQRMTQTNLEKKYDNSFVHSVFPVHLVNNIVDESKFNIDAVFNSLSDVCEKYKKHFEGKATIIADKPSPPTSDMAFTWIPFYREFSQKLLYYRNDRTPLINWIYDNLEGYINHFKDGTDGRRVPDTDPFTVFAIINRGITFERKQKICVKFKDFLNISAPIPQDFTSVPEMNNQRTNFMAFEDKREEEDIERLWKVFEDAVLDKDIESSYNALSNQYLINKNITMGLFWIRPDKYLALDGNNSSLLKSYGIANVKTGFVPYDEYKDIMTRLDAKMESGELECTNYPEFSLLAYKQNDGVITRDDPKGEEMSLFNSQGKVKQIPFSMFTLIDSIKKTGLHYEDKLIQRYVCSLMTKPFVILSGLAGSGKTQLALAFARAMSEDVEHQLCVVPVGADWTNREPLLGYPNALKPEEYIQPESGALQIMMSALRNQSKPYFLVLDEMNLSYVERYFADFLSALESHQEIPLWEKPDKCDSEVPAKIALPKNLFIIGTINVDETTYMFSPKVLDRANVIEFKISENEMEIFLKQNMSIEIEAVNGLCANMGQDFVEKSTKRETESSKLAQETLISFFKVLKKVNAEFGYRSATEIYRFIANAKAMAYDMTEDEILDAAIVQKLLPKLHGSRKKLDPALKALWGLCMQDEHTTEAITHDNVKFAKFPEAADKIQRMMQTALDNGFTSFAEA